MTCVCWDGQTLAADKQATNAGLRRAVTKIQRYGDLLLGVTGDWDTAAELREWFKAGAAPDKFPPKARDDIATLIVVSKDGVRSYCAGPYPMPIESPRCAWGSGRDYAEAAMFLGKTAAEAVQVAMQFDVSCGLGIDELELP